MEEADAMRVYEALEHLSHRMLSAAREADWELLAALEQDCRALVDGLPAGGESSPAEERRRRYGILRRILADDAHIRDLTEPWMTRSKQFLTSLALERQLLARQAQDNPP